MAAIGLTRIARRAETTEPATAMSSTSPTAVPMVGGDADMIRPDHVVSFYQLLGGEMKDAGWTREHMSRNRLAMLPDLTHYEVGAAPILAPTVLPFLDGKTWKGAGAKP